jgi:hypothetical protein
MSEFGKYGVGGKMPIPPYKEDPTGETVSDEVYKGTCLHTPDKTADGGELK